jgi:ABC-type polysaccharide/polyol phosphate export permease
MASCWPPTASTWRRSQSDWVWIEAAADRARADGRAANLLIAMAITKRQLAAAWRDLRSGLSTWRIWHLLASQEIRERYRRSVLGPFWLTISMGVQMLTMGVVVAILFQQSFGRVLPYVCIGLIFWTMLTGIINEGATAFVGASKYILHMRIPLTTYICQCMWRNVIFAGHNLIAYLVVAAIYSIVPTFRTALVLITMPLVIWSISWAALFLAVISTRFRDLPTMVGTGLNVLFWLTPIVYAPDQLGGNQWLATANPLAHVLDLVRLPLLNQVPTLNSFLIVIAMGLVGWTLTFLLFARFRARIPFWL